MAMGFFRRRQKLMMVVMVVLMVAFLISGSIRGLLSSDPSKRPIGEVAGKEVRHYMLLQADMQIRLLRDWLGLGSGRVRRPRPGEGAFRAFLDLNADKNAPLAWTLLSREAEDMGVEITDRQVDEFFAASGWQGDAYRREIANLTAERFTEKQIRQAVARYLAVMEAFSAARVTAPPSLPEMHHLFRDLEERIQLEIVAFPAEDFVDKAKTPSSDEVAQWFDRHKHLLADDASNRSDYGFGYRLPDRAEVTWLLVDRDSVRRAVEPTREQMLEYWQRHKGELTEKVPVPSTAPATATAPATQPATAPATAAATAPAAEPEYKTVVITQFSRARTQISDILKDRLTDLKTADLLAEAEKTVAEYADDPAAYTKARDRMSAPAKPLLDRPVPATTLTNVTIRDVIERLERAAKVRIVFPFGQYEKFSLDAEVKLAQVQWPATTLAAALEQVRRHKKLDLPPLTWITCRAFPDAIFPTAPVNLAPVSAGTTGMIGFKELQEHDVLGSASRTAQAARREDLLAWIVSTATQFQGPRPRISPQIEVGGDFRQAMYVSGKRTGRLLWRLLAAERAHTPEAMDDAIRAQVVKDLKIKDAFDLARDAARKMLADLQAGKDLPALAKAAKVEVTRTAPFARKTFIPYIGQVFWSRVEGVGMDSAFIAKAFELAPADPEPPHDDRPAAVVPLARRRNVFLIRRIGYEPMTQDAFRAGLYRTAMILASRRQRREVQAWFALANVVRRVGFTPKTE